MFLGGQALTSDPVANGFFGRDVSESQPQVTMVPRVEAAGDGHNSSADKA
jgi:hypothetical protein